MARSILASSPGNPDFTAQTVPMAALTPLMEEILARGGSVELTVTGGSMEPMLHDRKSRVRLAPPRALQRGDLPLYRRDGGAYVLHRVIAVEPDGYTCCGDAQWTPERGIRPEQIIAVTERFARGARWTKTDSALYGAYWRLWLAIRPLRRLVLGGTRHVLRMLGIAKEARGGCRRK